MRILFVSKALHKKFGGPPKAVVGVAVSLADIGHQVSILVSGQAKESVTENLEFYDTLKSHRVDVRVLNSHRTSVYGGIGSILENFQSLKQVRNSDCISLHSVYSFQNLIIAIFSFFTRTPFCVMPHGSLTRYQRQIHYVRKLFINPIFFAIVLNRATRIFVATQSEKDEINRSLYHKTKVVGLGIDVSRGHKKIIYGTAEREDFNFLFLGRIAPKKRIDLAIDAFQLLPEHVLRKSKLIICGDGDPNYVQSILRRVKNVSISDRLIFRGWVSGTEKSKVLANADCFLLTSEDENFAIAAGEALAAGVPCILSRHVALAEIVMKHGAGKIFTNLTPPDIAIAMMEMFNSVPSEMHRRASQASLELAWEVVVAKWDREFRSIVSEKK